MALTTDDVAPTGDRSGASPATGILARGTHRLQAAASGIPRLKNVSRPCSAPNAPACAPSGPARSRRLPRICPLRGFRSMDRTWPVDASRKMAVGRSVSLSRTTEPVGPESEMLASVLAHSARAGNAKTNPAAVLSAAADMAKRSENTSPPPVSSPATS